MSVVFRISLVRNRPVPGLRLDIHLTSGRFNEA